jgi:outer membrane receptor protein involved in Fe transport
MSRHGIVSFVVLLIFIIAAVTCGASVFGTIRTVVHDPQHRPMAGAEVVLKALDSSWTRTAVSDADGIAQFTSVPIGQYKVTISAKEFSTEQLAVSAQSDRVQEVHVAMRVVAASQAIEVTGTTADVQPSSATPESVVTRTEIVQTPGADRTNSLAFITNFVPGATVVHDQLHVRGGHQVTWAIDGVPVPNTNIASNVGPQFDPKDVEYLEAQRGSYVAEYGDRMYGVFNVVPRSGFERKREVETLLSYGSHNQTDNQISVGDHTERFAYYVSANGNRTDYGLEPPTFANLHNQAGGGGLFSSLTYNAQSGDQYRFVSAIRADNYQVPNTPELQTDRVRDHEREQDAFANFTYVHPFSASSSLSVTPFFHANRAAFEGGESAVPSANHNRLSSYMGGQVSLGYTKGKHNARVGMYGFAQRDSALFRIVANDGSGDSAEERSRTNGDLEAYFVEDQYKATNWLTLTGGVRVTRFSGLLTETEADPRLGVALRIPRLNWIARASYSRFYQAPPLVTVSGPVLELAIEQGFGFLPLRGERDEQHNFGLTIPLRGWDVDVDYFRTGAKNYFDHDALGNSNIFFPLTIDRVWIRGFETAVRSPQILGRISGRLVYSHQTVKGHGPVSGGLTDFAPPDASFFFLDHDQRDTLSTGVNVTLPWRAWVSGNLSYGSGFLEEDGPQHLPSYYTVDLAVGKAFGERWSVKLSATNIADERHFIDIANTFGGSHVNDPRAVALQVRYKFHY